MKEATVSVVIPVYNGAKTLRQCIKSVLNQTYSNYEVIVVDNNSTDVTKNIIKEFQNEDKRIKYIFEEHRSCGKALNTGIQLSYSEIIVITPADSIVPKDWIEELIKPIIYERETAVMGFEKDLVENYWTTHIQKADWKFIEQNYDGKYISHLDAKNFAIKASVLKNLMFDPCLISAEDFDFYLRLKEFSKIRFISSVKIGHYHKDSFLGVVRSNFRKAFWTARVYLKHRENKKLKTEIEETKNIFLKSFVLFPLWIIYQIGKKPIGEVFFIFVTELSWKAGIIWGLIRD